MSNLNKKFKIFCEVIQNDIKGIDKVIINDYTIITRSDIPTGNYRRYTEMKIKSIEEVIKPIGGTRFIVTYTSEKVRSRQFIRNSLDGKEFDFYMNSTNVKRYNRYGGAVAYIYE